MPKLVEIDPVGSLGKWAQYLRSNLIMYFFLLRLSVRRLTPEQLLSRFSRSIRQRTRVNYKLLSRVIRFYPVAVRTFLAPKAKLTLPPLPITRVPSSSPQGMDEGGNQLFSSYVAMQASIIETVWRTRWSESIGLYGVWGGAWPTHKRAFRDFYRNSKAKTHNIESNFLVPKMQPLVQSVAVTSSPPSSHHCFYQLTLRYQKSRTPLFRPHIPIPAKSIITENFRTATAATQKCQRTVYIKSELRYCTVASFQVLLAPPAAELRTPSLRTNGKSLFNFQTVGSRRLATIELSVLSIDNVTYGLRRPLRPEIAWHM